MADLSLVLYPDPRLGRPAERVTTFDGDLQGLVSALLRALDEIPAVGLTAPHFGVSQQVVVMRPSSEEEAQVFVNPEIIWSSTEVEAHEEGSVSMPGATERLSRPSAIRLRYQDVAGRTCEDDYLGWSATVLQHEIDQLAGVFWLDRLSTLKRDRLIKRWKKQSKRN